MFTGIVEAVGSVRGRVQRADGFTLSIAAGALPLDGVNVGDSIAVSGVCLTVTHKHADGFDADVSGATLVATTLGAAAEGTAVNLERALTPVTPLGGHLVSGHVDGAGEVVEVADVGGSRRLRVRVPAGLAHYVARKGSVCIDGVSLTVNAVDGADFEANLVPHTLERTTLGAARAGDRVNVEVDLVARYLERLLEKER